MSPIGFGSGLSFTDLLSYALGALWGHRLRSSLSLLGMAIGVAAVVVLTALGEGARRYVADQFTSLGTNLVIVIPGKTETTGAFPGVGGVPNDLTLEDYEVLIRSVREIRRSAPISMGTGTVSRGERRRQVAVAGSNHEFLQVRQLELARGAFLPEVDIHRGAQVVVLGWKVAHELFPGQDPLGEVVRIDGWRMRVIGVLAQRGVQLGLDLDDVVVIPVATGMRLFNRNTLFRIILEVRSYADLEMTQQKVLRVLAERHGEEDVTLVTQDAVASTFSSILGTLTLVLVAIASVSLSVAGVGIMNVMLVSVSERTHEVGLLKALGVARQQVVAVFLVEAALLSTAGGGLGLAVGWLAVRLVVGLYPDFPASAPIWAVAAALGVSLVVGILFGVLPARRASRLDPILALARR
ncbi:MAG: ABC transporter permease [Acidobacteriota bacterium]